MWFETRLIAISTPAFALGPGGEPWL